MRLTTNTFPTAQANVRLFALVQSDEMVLIYGGVWKEVSRSPAYLIQVVLFKK